MGGSRAGGATDFMRSHVVHRSDADGSAYVSTVCRDRYRSSSARPCCTNSGVRVGRGLAPGLGSGRGASCTAAKGANFVGPGDQGAPMHIGLTSDGLGAGRLEVDNVRLDLAGMLLWVDGRHVHITVQEALLLKVLMENAGRVLRREDLLTRVWGPERGRLSNTMSVVTSRLRRKLLRPDGTSRIRTIPTVGYILDTGRLD